MSLLPVEEAQRRLLALAAPLPPEQAALADAAGRWLAEPLVARRDQPWADLSAMDGYAVRWADMPGPWTLAGTIQAGGLPPEAPLAPGTAMRIFTGAPMPAGADTVVLQEDVEADGTSVRLTGEGPREEWRHVRPKGSDFAAGQLLLPEGSRLGPAQLALAALAGHGAVPVRARPRVAILSTGDELVPPGAPSPPGRLPASNGVMLRAMIEAAGGLVVSETLVCDELGAMIAALGALPACDIVVTSGGASVGDHDLVRPALEATGGSIDFWRIALRPGKPLIVGRLGASAFLGLPGNPVSALVTGALFLLPLVRHLAGAANPLPVMRPMPLRGALPATAGRTEYIRARIDHEAVTPLGAQDSAAMHGAALADALICRPAGAPEAQGGDLVEVLDWASLGLA
jgi:molybdopterin molybdotransferase